MRRSFIVLSLVMLPLLGGWIRWTEPESANASSAKAQKALLGLWSRFQPETEGDPQRFYYFHTGGLGLFRYGRMGLSYTQTFGYEVKGGRLKLTFNKTGEQHDVAYRIEGDVLKFVDDPRIGGPQAYTRRKMDSAAQYHAFGHPLARLWTQSTKDRKGSEGFRMYQLQAPTIDGRGVGWYHEGDFYEWSTETLQYRRTGSRLSLFFAVRNETHVTDLAEGEQDGVRTLSLAEDPRNFWHPRTYRDGGPGFTVSLAGAPLPYRVPGHMGACFGSADCSETPACPHSAE